MAKAFTKGQKVTVISDWNRRGVVSVRQATVYSCGSKQMKLTCDHTGEEFGRNLRPVVAEAGEQGVRPRLEGDALAAEAQAVSENTLEKERAHLVHCRDVVGPRAGGNYATGIQKMLDRLEAPTWGLYSDQTERIKAAIG